MTLLTYKNRATSLLAVGINDSVLEFSVTGGEGALFPTANFIVTIENERILVDSRSTDTFTVNASGRGYDGSSAAAHLAGVRVECRITAAVLENITSTLRDEARGAGALTVAASDTPALIKTTADYICDGTADQTEINTALGVANKVILCPGTFTLTASITLLSNQTLIGSGKATILTTATAHTNLVSAVGGSGTEKTNITVMDMQIDGATFGNAGIYLEYVDYSTIRNVYSIRHNDGTERTGIYLINSDFNQILNNVCNHSTYSGIALYTSNNNIISGNSCHGNSSNGGIYLDHSHDNTISANSLQGNGDGLYIELSDHNTFSGNSCKESLYYGLYMSQGEGNTVIGNACEGNTNEGIYINDANNMVVSGNTCNGNTGAGILHEGDNNIISSNTCQGNGDRGIMIDLSNHCTVSSNICFGNSQVTDNSKDNIYLVDSDYNLVTNNKCRDGGGAKQPRYGIRINNSACDGNIVEGNDLYDSGKTGDISDIGTLTRKRNNVAIDGTWLADDNLLISEIDDAPVDGVTTAPISSNWAFDHINATDPHESLTLQVVADATARDALTPAVGKLVWQTDTAHPYICTAV